MLHCRNQRSAGIPIFFEVPSRARLTICFLISTTDLGIILEKAFGLQEMSWRDAITIGVDSESEATLMDLDILIINYVR